MRREELFNRSGYYRFLLDSNALLHREAAAEATEALSSLLLDRAANKPERVLDLACGGWPTAISGVMVALPSRAFEYTGIDINPDQNPNDSAESLRLIDAARIAAAGLPALEVAEDRALQELAWCEDYLQRMGRTLIARCGDPKGTESTIAHMRQRDYPVSTGDLSRILCHVGFSTRCGSSRPYREVYGFRHVQLKGVAHRERLSPSSGGHGLAS